MQIRPVLRLADVQSFASDGLMFIAAFGICLFFGAGAVQGKF